MSKKKGWSKEARAKQAKGHKNITPYSKEDRERASKAGKKGGVLSGVTKRRNQTFKDLAREMLSNRIPEDAQKRLKELFPELTQNDITYRTAGLAKQIQKMMNGDTKAFEVVRDTAGEKPVDKNAMTDLDGNPMDTQIKVTFVKAKE